MYVSTTFDTRVIVVNYRHLMVTAKTGLWLPGSDPELPLGRLKGRVTIWSHAPDQKPEDGQMVWDDHNLYTSAGYRRIVAWLAAASPTPPVPSPNYIMVGTGVGTAASADQHMTFEVARLASTQVGVISSYTVTISTTFGGSTANGALTEIGLSDTLGDNGIASSGGASTLTDVAKAWTVNAWGLTTPASKVNIILGTGIGQQKDIVSNTATQLTVSTPWATAPDATSRYLIQQPYLFAHANISVTKTVGQSLTVLWQITVPSA